MKREMGAIGLALAFLFQAAVALGADAPGDCTLDLLKVPGPVWVTSADLKPIDLANPEPWLAEVIEQGRIFRGDRYYLIRMMEGDRGEEIPHFTRDGKKDAVEYLSDEQLKDYRLEWKNGNASTKRRPQLHGKLIYVMNDRGEIFIGADGDHEHDGVIYHFHHSSMARGQPVAAAGDIFFVKGKLKAIGNMSGHYVPPDRLTRQVLSRLAELGVPLDEVEVLNYNAKAFAHNRVRYLREKYFPETLLRAQKNKNPH